MGQERKENGRERRLCEGGRISSGPRYIAAMTENIALGPTCAIETEGRWCRTDEFIFMHARSSSSLPRGAASCDASKHEGPGRILDLEYGRIEAKQRIPVLSVSLAA